MEGVQIIEEAYRRTLYRYVHWPEVDTRVIAVAPVKDATVMLLL